MSAILPTLSFRDEPLVVLATLVSLALVAITGASCTPRAGDEPRAAAPAPSALAVDVVAPDLPEPSSTAASPPPLPTAELLPPEEWLPKGFVLVGEPNSDRDQARVPCGDFSIENAPPPDPNGNYEPFVRAYDRHGKKIYEAHGRTYELDVNIKVRQSLVVDICGDLTGDGVPELIMTERTMGAHCCYTHYIVSLTAPPKRLLMWEKGDSGDGMTPTRFSPSGPWQVMSYDRVMPPFDPEQGEPALVYAGIPGYPVIFDFVGGEYKRRTFAFPSALRELRAEGRAACAEQPGCEPDPIYEWGLALMIGDWDQEKTKIVPDPEERRPFERRAKEMTAALRLRLGP